MTALQLNAALHREMSHIVTDSTMMERALKSLRRIRKERKAEQLQQVDSAEQITANLRHAFQEFKLVQQGKAKTREFFEVLNEL